MVTEKEEEFRECLSKINTSFTLKELIEKVMIDMEDKDDLKLDYYNFFEDTKRINDGIIEEEKEMAREIGLKEGREEGRSEMIVNLYNNGASIDLISKSTGLSINDIEKMVSQLKKK